MMIKKVKVGDDQAMTQSDIPTPKTEVGKNELTIRYLYNTCTTKSYRKPSDQLFFQ